MAKGPRIPRDSLVSAGLDLMRKNGKELERAPGKGRSMVYRMANGETVRLRTSNDHILIAGAETPSEGASLNIEGTDWLLIVMPAVERTPGPVVAHLVPTAEAIEAVRKEHAIWLDSRPKTGGENVTWCLRFNQNGIVGPGTMFEEWAKYRLPDAGGGSPVSLAEAAAGHGLPAGDTPSRLALNMQDAKRALAAFYGVPVEAIEITIRG